MMKKVKILEDMEPKFPKGSEIPKFPEPPKAPEFPKHPEFPSGFKDSPFGEDRHKPQPNKKLPWE